MRMTGKEVENIRNELFEDGYNRNQEQIEKLTAGIKRTEAEESYPVPVRVRLEEQRKLLRDILIEGNNLLPWREATTDLDELKKALSIYAAKLNSKNPGDETAGYAWDIARKIQLYWDQEDFIEIEKTAATGNKGHGEAPALNQDGLGEALEYFFTASLKEKYPETYKAVKSGLIKGCILFDGKKLNFKLPVGMVSRLFYHTGYTEIKEIAQYILIDGKDPKVSSLRSPLNFRGGLWPELKKLLEL
jgi:hypothetical protein